MIRKLRAQNFLQNCNLEEIGSLLAEGVQELEGSSHLIGGHQVLVVKVGLAQEESNDGDLSPVLSATL
jgi:hypothetical protein